MACLLACHWRHPVGEYPLRGDEVHRALQAEPGLSVLAEHLEEDFVLHVFTRPTGGFGRQGDRPGVVTGSARGVGWDRWSALSGAPRDRAWLSSFLLATRNDAFPRCLQAVASAERAHHRWNHPGGSAAQLGSCRARSVHGR